MPPPAALRRTDPPFQPSPSPGAAARVFFGGPDRPARYLRDLLEARVEAVPPGGEILWATYYFRDERLAEALARARRRGVAVMLALEGHPRLRTANDAVIRRLARPDGLGAGLRVVRHALPAHLHEKLYCFSHPRPVALVGSFNPSGNEPEDPAVIRAIRDQDRGHNVLVELAEPALVAGLAAHARWVHGSRHGLLERFAPELNAPLCAGGLQVHFFPRRQADPLDRLLRALRPRAGVGAGAGARLRVASSHLRDGGMVARLAALAAGGVRVEILAEATTRRVPRRVERRLRAGGAVFRRYLHPQGLPMHNKFLLADGPQGSWLAFGSFNLTRSSRWLNHEILAVTEDSGLFDAFARRWEEMVAEPWTVAAEPGR